MDLHPLCEPLAGLLGTWRGPGSGSYPTIDDFSYVEELTFSHVGKPFLTMMQRSRDGVSGEPLHGEAGYLRSLGDGAVELAVASPLGITEVHLGSVSTGAGSLVVEFESTHIGLSPTAKSTTAIRRRMELTGSTLVSELWMAAVGETELIHHVRSVMIQQG